MPTGSTPRASSTTPAAGTIRRSGSCRACTSTSAPIILRRTGSGRAVALTEFGGYTLAVPGHTWGKKRFGYKPLRDEAALADAFRRLYEQQIIPAKEKGLAASVYTQLSDVEDECNGFVTYDRKVVKLPKQLVREISLSLKD